MSNGSGFCVLEAGGIQWVGPVVLAWAERELGAGPVQANIPPGAAMGHSAVWRELQRRLRCRPTNSRRPRLLASGRKCDAGLTVSVAYRIRRAWSVPRWG